SVDEGWEGEEIARGTRRDHVRRVARGERHRSPGADEPLDPVGTEHVSDHASGRSAGPAANAAAKPTEAFAAQSASAATAETLAAQSAAAAGAGVVLGATVAAGAAAEPAALVPVLAEEPAAGLAAWGRVGGLCRWRALAGGDDRRGRDAARA